MPKKQAAQAESDESILESLGIGESGHIDPGTGHTAQSTTDKPLANADPSTDDRIKALVGTIEGLNTRVGQMQDDFTRVLSGGGGATIAAPQAPQLKEVTLEGLPSQEDDPAGFAKGLNTRMTETLQANLAALTAHQAQAQAASAQIGARGDHLWDTFQEDYFPQLEKGLPDTINDVTPYVETAAKAVAVRAMRGISDPAQKQRVLDSYMYGTPKRFMDDVFAEVDAVLAPLRQTDEGEKGGADGPTPGEVAAHRTGGIDAAGGGKKGTSDADDQAAAGTLLGDIEAVQRATGFF